MIAAEDPVVPSGIQKQKQWLSNDADSTAPQLQNKHTIPVVDFAQWTSSSNKEERLKVAKDLVEACQKVGFVYIINHGVSEARVEEAFALSSRLFDLSLEDKMKAPHPDGSAVHRGYSYPGLEMSSPTVPDCKESYEVGSENNYSQPNVWLPEQVLPGFRDFTTSFYSECYAVAMTILRALTMGLELDDPEFLTKYHNELGNQLRLLHYPPVPAAKLETQEVGRISAHSDWPSVTLLFQDDCGGLEIEDPHSPGKFVPATPMKGALVMNIGDMLMRWSNDSLKSTQHRVTLPPLADRYEGENRMTRARYSIVYFTAPDLDTVVECIPTCASESNPAKYEPVTWGDYMVMKAKQQYPDKVETAA